MKIFICFVFSLANCAPNWGSGQESDDYAYTGTGSEDYAYTGTGSEDYTNGNLQTLLSALKSINISSHLSGTWRSLSEFC